MFSGNDSNNSMQSRLIHGIKKILGFDTDPNRPLISSDNGKEVAALVTIVFLIRTFGFGLYQVPSGSMETTMLVGGRFFADKCSYLFIDPKINDVISFNDPTYPYSQQWLRRLWEDYVWGPANWTKRIIGGPGDVVEGRIEDGKPVVYRNGVKLDEPYLNKYPLVAVYKENPAKLSVYKRECDECETTFYSYDPSKTLDNQPFYHINPYRVITDYGQPIVRWPGTLINKARVTADRIEDPQGNYYNGTDVFYVTLADDEYWCMGDNRLASHDSRFFGPVKRSLIHGRILFCIFSVDATMNTGLDESWFIVDLIKHPIDFWRRVHWDKCLSWVR